MLHSKNARTVFDNIGNSEGIMIFGKFSKRSVVELSLYVSTIKYMLRNYIVQQPLPILTHFC